MKVQTHFEQIAIEIKRYIVYVETSLLLLRAAGAAFVIAPRRLRPLVDVGVGCRGRHAVVLGGRLGERELDPARPRVQDGEGAGGGGAENGDKQGGRCDSLN